MWVKIFDQRPLNKTYLPRKWTWRCLLRCLNEVVGRWHRRDLFVGDPNEHTMGIKVEAWVTCDRQFGRAPPSHTLQSKNTSRSANVNLFFGRRGSTPTKVRWRSAQKPRHDKCKRDFYSWGDADWRFPKKKKKIVSRFADDGKYRVDWMAFLKFYFALKRGSITFCTYRISAFFSINGGPRNKRTAN